MTIMFQLFSAKDLQMLTYDEILEVKDIVILAMNDKNKTSKLQDYQTKAGQFELARKQIRETRRAARAQARAQAPAQAPGTQQTGYGVGTPKLDKDLITLGLSNNTKPLTDISQGNSMLQKRLNEIRQQLRDSRESAPYDQDSFEKAIEPQNTSEASDKLDEKEQLILEWGLSCERNFIEFYAPLRRARDVAHEYFFEKTGQRPEGPDSAYSPFSSDHPLRRRSSGLYE